MSLLEVANVDTAYGAINVNRDVSLTVDEHEIATILGPNGAGKTTLLRAISGAASSRSADESCSMARTSRGSPPTVSPRSASSWCRKGGASSPT